MLASILQWLGYGFGLACLMAGIAGIALLWYRAYVENSEE